MKEKAYKGCGWSIVGFLVWLAYVTLVWAMVGCKNIEYVPVIEHRTDTVIKTHQRLDIRARLDLHPRARRHGMGGAMAHPLARPPAAGHHLRGGARHRAGAASGDRYLASAIGHARYLSPWQRADVVATDTNIHRQYSDICHDHTVDNIFP